MSNSGLITQLRQKALDVLQESSAAFEAANVLLKEGKTDEAKQRRELARQKRFESSWLMAEADRLEKESPPESATI